MGLDDGIMFTVPGVGCWFGDGSCRIDVLIVVVVVVGCWQMRIRTRDTCA